MFQPNKQTDYISHENFQNFIKDKLKKYFCSPDKQTYRFRLHKIFHIFIK